MPAKHDLENYIQWTRDRFAYVRLDAPNFPPEDETSTAEQFAKLCHGISEIIRRTRNPHRRRWLDVVLRDLELALLAYESGDRKKGIKIMYSAEEHFKNAIHGKKFQPARLGEHRPNLLPCATDDPAAPLGGGGMQSNLNLDEYIRRARDRFGYLIVSAPMFSCEQTTAASQFGKQREQLVEILRRTKKSNRRAWLEVTLRELDESLVAYESDDIAKGLDVLYSAEEHFNNAIQGKEFDRALREEHDTNAGDNAPGGPEEAIFEQEVQNEVRDQAEAGNRFEQWLKEHPESPWHGVLAKVDRSFGRPPLLRRWLNRLMGGSRK